MRSIGRLATGVALVALCTFSVAVPASASAPTLQWRSPRVLHSIAPEVVRSIDACPPGARIVGINVLFAGGGVGTASDHVAADGSWRFAVGFNLVNVPRGDASITAACFDEHGYSLASYAPHHIRLKPLA